MSQHSQWEDGAGLSLFSSTNRGGQQTYLKMEQRFQLEIVSAQNTEIKIVVISKIIIALCASQSYNIAEQIFSTSTAYLIGKLLAP